MYNQKLSQMLNQIADYLEMDDVAFKPAAYRRAAIGIETLNKDIGELYETEGRAGLLKIDGVGEAIAGKIIEYLNTNHIKLLDRLKRKTPVALEELMAIEGLGPKKIKTLYQQLRIKNLADLEQAIKKHRIANLFGFGSKTETNLLQAINFLKKGQGRFLLGKILPEAENIYHKLADLQAVKKISLAGSLRRMKETIGDVDILVVSDKPEAVMDCFIQFPNVVKVWGQGRTKASIRTEQGFDVDLRVIPEKSYGAALQYFTGSKEHNIRLRKIAIEKGYKLNEYGLFRGRQFIPTTSEEDVYRILGLAYIPPELRENRGEIEAALQSAKTSTNKLPRLVTQKDIKGDFHCHSNWNGGNCSIIEIAEKARWLGYQYVGIADHTQSLKIENGLDEKRLLKRNQEIDRLNKQFSHFKILKGCEANIMADGSLDINDSTLSQLDFVIAGVHSKMKMTQAAMTSRIIKAMSNPYVDIISHPTGRLINRRDEYAVDIEKIFKAAAATNTVLEINAAPERLDLNDVHIMQAKKYKVKLVINSDSHQLSQLELVRFGVAQARRGWAETDDIVNCQPLTQLDLLLKSKIKK